jgi:hypothetical protein
LLVSHFSLAPALCFNCADTFSVSQMPWMFLHLCLPTCLNFYHYSNQLPILPFIQPTIHPSIYPTNYPSFHLSNQLSILPFVQPTIHPSIYPTNYPFFYLSNHYSNQLPSIHLVQFNSTRFSSLPKITGFAMCQASDKCAILVWRRP